MPSCHRSNIKSLGFIRAWKTTKQFAGVALLTSTAFHRKLLHVVSRSDFAVLSCSKGPDGRSRPPGKDGSERQPYLKSGLLCPTSMI